MKLAAAILACIVLITSFYPVPKEYLKVQNDSQHMCCMKQHMPCSKEQQQKKDAKNSCTNGSCSPFSVCNYYPVTPAFFYKVTAPKLVFVNIEFSYFNADIFSHYCAEIWHPPRAI